MKPAIAFCFLLLLPVRGNVQRLEPAIEQYERGKFQAAFDTLSGLIQQSPSDKTLRIWQGKTLMKLRRWDDAITQFRKAVELGPNDGMSHLWLGRAYGRKAEHALIGLGPAKMTRSEFETAVKLAPDAIEIRFDLLDFYLEAPGFLGGGRDKAEMQAQEIGRLSPRLGCAAQAEILEQNHELERARGILVQATTKYPEDAGAHLDLAKFLMRTGRTGEAERYAQKAISLGGGSREARMILGAIQVELGQNLPGALKVLQDLVSGPLSDDDPSFEEAYYWLGRAYFVLGRKDEARKAWQDSLSFNPDYTQSKDALKQTR